MVQDLLKQSFLTKTFLHNKIEDYLITLSVFLISLTLIWIMKRLALKRLKAWAYRTSTRLDNFLIQTIQEKAMPLVYIAVFDLSIRNLTLHPTLDKVINILMAIALTFFGARFGLDLIAYGLETYWRKKESDPTKSHGYQVMIWVTRILGWGLAVLILLDNLPIKISPLLTGLGIGGIAVAFAAQAVLQDIFSFVTIFLDRPFEIGDFIVIGEYLGTVEQIGIKTTRLRSLSGEQLILSNKDLTNSRVRNYKRMSQRRVVLTLGVIYDTSLELLQDIPGIIEGIIKSVDNTLFDRSHFTTYGDFGLIFESVYYVTSSDYNLYMDIQQAINFKIKAEFAQRKIHFAYPTQTLFVHNIQQA